MAEPSPVGTGGTRDARPPRSSSAVRFGITIAGVDVLTPAGRSAEFLAGVAVHPLPWAPRRVRGMAQLRGHPVTVLDASVRAPTSLPIIEERPLLVIGVGSDAAMALIVEAPPRQLKEMVHWRGDAPARPRNVFASALTVPMIESSDGPGVGSGTVSIATAGRIWWEADFDRLFQDLVGDR